MSQTMNNTFRDLLGVEWYDALKEVLESSYWKRLGEFVAKERRSYTVYPLKYSDLLFKAFRTTPISKVKVVILGQDPYHDGSYDGFAFSNSDPNKRVSPSLQNIFKEVENDLYNGLKLDQDPNLQRWAEQGVLLINTAHTVREGQPASHLEHWMPFTVKVIETLLKQERLVWILWGKKAQNLVNVNHAMQITKGKHKFIQSSHPSPFSAHIGFYGSKPFSQTNEFLEKHGTKRIEW